MADSHEQYDLAGNATTVANDPLPIGQSTPYLGRVGASQLSLGLPDPTTLAYLELEEGA